VYKARALYDIVFDTLRIFVSNCSGEMMGERMAHGTDSTDLTPGLSKNGEGGIMSVTDASGQKYALFLNPNDGNFILQQAVPDNEPVEVEVCDAVGRTIYKEKLLFSDAMSNIQIGNVASGLYLLHVTDSKGRMFKFKFVKE